MQLKLYLPFGICEKGKRSKNEDNIYPMIEEATSQSRTFIVCDGVGGAAKGELASHIVAESFGLAFEKKIASQQSLDTVLESTQQTIDTYLLENNQNRGMGTTLAFLQLNEKGAVIAHAGDSRVYHFRNDKVMFCTDDHSLVNELKNKGRFEEAKVAKNNVITRAIQGSSKRKIKLDVQIISEIKAGDYFLLCSDGVWSVLTENKLISILRKDVSDQHKIELMKRTCLEFSKDNFSAYLIRVKEVILDEVKKIDEDFFNGLSRNPDNEKIQILVENTRKSGINWIALVMLIISGLIAIGIWYYYFN